MPSEAYILDLCERHLGGRPSPGCVAELAALPVERPDVRAFVERMFRLMEHARFSSSDLSVAQGEVIGSLLSRILPGAWEGRIPPITVAGRHARIDEYLVCQTLPEEGLLVDVGCGFPPLTTLETADRLPGWRVIGADPSLPAYLVYDEDDNYATFDESRRLVYCQPASPTPDNWNALLNDQAATRARFEALLESMLSVQRGATPGPGDAAPPGAPRLLRDPVQQYEREGLSFEVAGLGGLDVDGADVVRCFNVLYYFDAPFRERALAWCGGMLRDGGLLVTGGDWAHTTECRYHVRRKEDGRLVLREFAFSVDNACPFAVLPWYTLHDDDEEVALLADLLRVLRADERFRTALLGRSDALRVEHDLCPRGSDGHYGGIDPKLPSDELWGRAALIVRTLEEEFVDRAVDVLRSAGWEAWHNEVDHVAVLPGAAASGRA